MQLSDMPVQESAESPDRATSSLFIALVPSNWLVAVKVSLRARERISEDCIKALVITRLSDDLYFLICRRCSLWAVAAGSNCYAVRSPSQTGILGT